MERGFFHPEKGYWQTTGEPPDDIKARYPKGTQEVPLQPSDDHSFDGTAWVLDPEKVAAKAAKEAEERARKADLSQAQFEWILAFTGLGDVWDGIEAALKDTDRATYAAIRMQRKRSVYQLDVTLQEVAKMRPLAAKIAPDVERSCRNDGGIDHGRVKILGAFKCCRRRGGAGVSPARRRR